MHTATLTFETVGRRADRALSIVLLVKHVKHEAAGVFLFSALNFALRSLLKSVSVGERLNGLSEQQATQLKSSLCNVHEGLNDLLNKHIMCVLKRKPLLRRLISSIEEQTEDLYDIIENLALAQDVEFRKMVAECAENLSGKNKSIGCSPEPVGRM